MFCRRYLLLGLYWLSMLGIGIPTIASADQDTTAVFISGKEGYRSFRIPAIITLPKGDLLAFAEGRVNGPADFGNVDIVMKRSTDGGKNWSALQVIVDQDTLQAGNPAPVMDLTDPAFPKGRIFLFYNTGDAAEADIRAGKGTRRIKYICSSDGGRTWDQPKDITYAVKRSTWRSYANTPGHAFQFATGPYRGRIYVSANHSAGPPQPDFTDYKAHGFFSDDHGKTFHLSEDVPFPGGNEATAAMLPSGGLIMNIRNQAGTPRCRITSISSDGGMHWDTTFYDHRMPDPVCEGSLLNLTPGEEQAVLAFCNNNDTARRRNLTLRISRDGGKSWDAPYIIDNAPGGTAYCDLVRMGGNTLGILYEKDGYSSIVFRRVSWAAR